MTSNHANLLILALSEPSFKSREIKAHQYAEDVYFQFSDVAKCLGISKDKLLEYLEEQGLESPFDMSMIHDVTTKEKIIFSNIKKGISMEDFVLVVKNFSRIGVKIDLEGKKITRKMDNLRKRPDPLPAGSFDLSLGVSLPQKKRSPEIPDDPMISILKDTLAEMKAQVGMSAMALYLSSEPFQAEKNKIKADVEREERARLAEEHKKMTEEFKVSERARIAESLRTYKSNETVTIDASLKQYENAERKRIAEMLERRKEWDLQDMETQKKASMDKWKRTDMHSEVEKLMRESLIKK